MLLRTVYHFTRCQLRSLESSLFLITTFELIGAWGSVVCVISLRVPGSILGVAGAFSVASDSSMCRLSL
jgi:hypothetical protein